MIEVYCSAGLEEKARTLCTAQDFPFGGASDDISAMAQGYILYLDPQGLSLRQTGRKAMGPVRCDFVGGSAHHRRLYGGGKSQAIAKAVGIKDKVRPTVADLTAGMGTDAFVLATLGCRVTMVERNPVVAALLADGLERARVAAQQHGELAAIVARMALHPGDGVRWLELLPADERPDVIYLDPMFPERKKSAQVNKTMQAFQQLVGDDADADNLLPLALAMAVHRVVVKRPSRAPWLNNQKPGVSMEGKSVRFDVYALKSLAGRLKSEV